MKSKIVINRILFLCYIFICVGALFACVAGSSEQSNTYQNADKPRIVLLSDITLKMFWEDAR